MRSLFREFLCSGITDRKSTVTRSDFNAISHRISYKLDLIGFWPASTKTVFLCPPEHNYSVFSYIKHLFKNEHLRICLTKKIQEFKPDFFTHGKPRNQFSRLINNKLRQPYCQHFKSTTLHCICSSLDWKCSKFALVVIFARC